MCAKDLFTVQIINWSLILPFLLLSHVTYLLPHRLWNKVLVVCFQKGFSIMVMVVHLPLMILIVLNANLVNLKQHLGFLKPLKIRMRMNHLLNHSIHLLLNNEAKLVIMFKFVLEIPISSFSLHCVCIVSYFQHKWLPNFLMIFTFQVINKKMCKFNISFS